MGNRILPAYTATIRGRDAAGRVSRERKIMSDISIIGRKIFINVPVSWKNPAVKMSSGRIRLNGPGAQAIDKKPDSFIRSKDPGVQFGEQIVHGHATVALDLDELRLLAFRASRNLRSERSRVRPKHNSSGTNFSNRRNKMLQTLLFLIYLNLKYPKVAQPIVIRKCVTYLLSF
jgi:hypothetical protein